ncbi:MAG: PQQ-binding-like beta-propeller repeat protein, partial [Deltaproteobacteria bacterium]|nr:PQQ-binding-like beta-propeller repeat protein [Deltaproteobacteria bacterium]
VDSMYSFNKKTGSRIWEFKTVRALSSPSVAGSVLYFGGNDKNLYALDIESGEELWRFKTKGEIETSAAIDKGVVYFGSNDGYMYALE